MIFQMDNCGACRTCEIMCCFHHTGTFGFSTTSLRVQENPKGKGYLIVIAESDGKGLISCDACKNLETPLCMEVCKEAEQLRAYIEAVKAEQKQLQQVAERG